MRSKYARSLLISLPALLLLSTTAAAKPQPHPELIQLLEMLSEFETGFESDNWDGARRTLAEITEKLQAQADYAEKDDVNPKAVDFSPVVGKLSLAVQEQNKEKTQKLFLLFQQVLLSFVDQFDYKVHPMIMLMGKYISKDVVKAAETRNFIEAKNELREIAAFNQKARKIFLEHGISKDKLIAFSDQISAAFSACEEENIGRLDKSLENMRRIFKSFLENF